MMASTISYKLMESVNTFSQLNKTQLQELCELIDQTINHYETLIRRQLDLTNKNYKTVEELILDLITTYKKIRNDKLRD